MHQIPQCLMLHETLFCLALCVNMLFPLKGVYLIGRWFLIHYRVSYSFLCCGIFFVGNTVDISNSLWVVVVGISSDCSQ